MTEGFIVSIVLPVYNIGACLRQTMDSIVGQTYEDMEIICIDDGSTDDSRAILEGYAARDDRIALHVQENAGQGAARNRGLELARGRYVMLLDADDVYETTFVEKMATRAAEVDADIVVCRSGELDDATGKTRACPWTVKTEQLPPQDPFSVHDMYDFIFTAFIGWPWDKFFKRSFLVDHALSFPDMENSEDLHFVFLALVHANRISFLDEQLILHRVGRSGSVSNSRTRAPMAFYEAICLLKAELRRDPARFEKLSWGFLNWAFDYTIWNIESMSDEGTRRAMLAEVMAGNCPELEIFAHSKPFFGLERSDLPRFRRLLAQSGQVGGTTKEDAHPLLYWPAVFLDEARVFGFRKAFGKAFAKLRRDRHQDIPQERSRYYFERGSKEQRS